MKLFHLIILQTSQLSCSMLNVKCFPLHPFSPLDDRSADEKRTTQREEAGRPAGSTGQGEAEEDEEGKAGWH